MIELPFRRVVSVDYEFGSRPGENPEPLCVTARELRTGETRQLWIDGAQPATPPFDIGPDAVMVGHYVSAELGCLLALGQPLPAHVIDTFAEFRVLTNGVLPRGASPSLLGALAHFGLDAITASEKKDMRLLILRGRPYTESERTAILTYNESDVVAVAALLPKLLPRMKVPQALLRGRYMKACAMMERRGIPIDVPLLTRIRNCGDALKLSLVKAADGYGFYDGTTFKAERFGRFLDERGYAWPRYPNGKPRLDEGTFRDMGRLYPEVNGIGELRTTLSQLRTEALAVGEDGRNRTVMSAFHTATGRAQPRRSVFSLSAWFRGLIKPEPGRAVAYLDWSAQEFGIAAALSGDETMVDAYRTADPYIAMAKLADMVPAGATKHTHPRERGIFKVVALAIQYGMQAESLALTAGLPIYAAHEILRRMRTTFHRCFAWSSDQVDRAMLGHPLETLFGWPIRATTDAKPGTFLNFPVQSAASEMMRLAAIFTTEAGLPVCWTVHDALLVEAGTDEIDDIVEAVRSIMMRASEVVTRGLPIRVGVEVVRHPDRYMDPRGEAMWRTVMGLLGVVSGTTREWPHAPQIRSVPGHPLVAPDTTPDPRES